MIKFLPLILCLLFSVTSYDLEAQKLKNLGLKKAKDRLKKMVDDVTEVESETDEPDKASGEKTLTKRMSKAEVSQAMSDAGSSLSKKDYSEARYLLQQSLVEIEHQLGEKVLEEMPASVNSQSYDPEQDMVISTGAGFIGLEIKRSYPSNNGDIEAIIANNSVLLGPYTMALSNPQYMSSNENMKSVKVQGRRGVLELSGDTYNLAIPMGQSSVFLLSCESCSAESEIMSLASEFDLNKYIDILGEAPLNLDEK